MYRVALGLWLFYNLILMSVCVCACAYLRAGEGVAEECIASSVDVLRGCVHSPQMKEQLLKKVEELGPLLPTNTLDELIDGLGGPSKVSKHSQPANTCDTVCGRIT